MDYSKLTADLKIAKEVAEKAAKGEDGGSCNYDCLCLRVPRAREEKVLDAIKKAGLWCLHKSQWFGPCYLISPGKCGQANSRYRAVEAMYKAMKEAGWNTGIYYQMD